MHRGDVSARTDQDAQLDAALLYAGPRAPATRNDEEHQLFEPPTGAHGEAVAEKLEWITTSLSKLSRLEAACRGRVDALEADTPRPSTSGLSIALPREENERSASPQHRRLKSPVHPRSPGSPSRRRGNVSPRTRSNWRSPSPPSSVRRFDGLCTSPTATSSCSWTSSSSSCSSSLKLRPSSSPALRARHEAARRPRLEHHHLRPTRCAAR